jgi:DNA-directed RNA polymerase subunit M/transcription elongation factor TFIIS
MDLVEQQIKDIFEYDRYYNGAVVGDKEVCDKCGEHTLTCVLDKEDEGTGVHTWLFRCSNCGYEDFERW